MRAYEESGSHGSLLCLSEKNEALDPRGFHLANMVAGGDILSEFYIRKYGTKRGGVFVPQFSRNNTFYELDDYILLITVTDCDNPIVTDLLQFFLCTSKAHRSHTHYKIVQMFRILQVRAPKTSLLFHSDLVSIYYRYDRGLCSDEKPANSLYYFLRTYRRNAPPLHSPRACCDS